MIRIDDEPSSARWYPHDHSPCCDSCGTGGVYDESTSGLCWDCQATGHPHAPAWGWGSPSKFGAS